jgi:hypothetical protein
MLEHGTEFYKKPFRKDPRENFSLDDSFWEEHENVSLEENEMLTAKLSEEEIKGAIDSSYNEGALTLMVFHLCSTKSFDQPLRLTSWL